MNIITVATHDEAYLSAYEQSCKKHALCLKILGWNELWRGLTWRFYLMKEFLKDMPDDEIIIFTDAYDVICLENSDEIKRKFVLFNKPIVFGICNPLKFLVPKLLDIVVYASYKKYIINAGCYIGYVSSLRVLINEILDNIKINNYRCDQKLLNCYYKKAYLLKKI